MDLIRKGYFREMPHGLDSDPSIKDYINYSYDKDYKDNICNYLETGIPVAICAGTVEDVIDPSSGNAGVPSSYTDGTWIWPGDLVYYVRKYNLKLDEEFTDTMSNNEWTIPIKEEDVDLDNLSVDGEKLFD